MNEPHRGDNLDVLRAMAGASVDLIHLDPPFNSKSVHAAPASASAPRSGSS